METTDPLIPVVVRADPNAVPALLVGSGPRAEEKFVEFFTARIRNPNTRSAYLLAVRRFFAWAESAGLSLPRIRPVHVAAYVESLTRTHAAPTVKQHLAAVRMLFDYLVVGQVVEMNPAAAVRGPSYSAKKGKTPVLTEEEARHLIERIDTAHVVGLRDRALIAVMVYGFARVGAVVGKTRVLSSRRMTRRDVSREDLPPHLKTNVRNFYHVIPIATRPHNRNRDLPKSHGHCPCGLRDANSVKRRRKCDQSVGKHRSSPPNAELGCLNPNERF